MTYSANIEDVLTILGDEDSGIYWEEAWDTLQELDESDAYLVERLKQVLASYTSSKKRDNGQKLRKVWCIRAIKRIGAVDKCLPELRLQLLCREEDVAVEVLAALNRSRKLSEVTNILIEAFWSWRGWPLVRCRVFLALMAISGGPMRAVRLIRSSDKGMN